MLKAHSEAACVPTSDAPLCPARGEGGWRAASRRANSAVPLVGPATRPEHEFWPLLRAVCPCGGGPLSPWVIAEGWGRGSLHPPPPGEPTGALSLNLHIHFSNPYFMGNGRPALTWGCRVQSEAGGARPGERAPTSLTPPTPGRAGARKIVFPTQHCGGKAGAKGRWEQLRQSPSPPEALLPVSVDSSPALLSGGLQV